MLKLKREVGFDPLAELADIARLAAAWRSQFRPAQVAYTPGYIQAELDKLSQAQRLRLYLVTRPAEPVALAILDGLDPDQAVDLMALCPLEGPDVVWPLTAGPARNRALMQDAPEQPSGQGVYAFLKGEPQGLAWLDLEPEGLVLAMARWGQLNLLDPSPLFARRLRRLGELIRERAAPPGQ